MVRLGAHTSIAGGVQNAPKEARELGCDTFQLFAKNQRQWNAKPYSKDDIAAWHDALKANGYTGADVITHASYLINPAADGDDKLKRARAALKDELVRADQLGIHGVCFHPGSHTGRGVDVGLPLIRASIEWVLSEVETETLLMPEVMAGQGSNMGDSLEELGAIVAGFDEDRVGVTLDTCHLIACGVDYRGDRWGAFMDALDTHVGVDRVGAWHLNDSQHDLGTKKDRHERIGEGAVGEAGFRPLLNEPRFRDTIGTLETDPLDDYAGYHLDLKRLRDWSPSPTR